MSEKDQRTEQKQKENSCNKSAMGKHGGALDPNTILSPSAGDQSYYT